MDSKMTQSELQLKNNLTKAVQITDGARGADGVTMETPLKKLEFWDIGAIVPNREHQKENQAEVSWGWSGKRGSCVAWGLRTQALE